MSEYIKRYKLEVEIQDNGIIRDPFGWVIGRCDDEWFNAVVRHELPECEQPERTCKNLLPPDWGTFECSQCDGQYSVVPVYITAGGTPNDDPDTSCVNYCPHCGAKVVE